MPPAVIIRNEDREEMLIRRHIEISSVGMQRWR